ncbi:uncharacterized protein TrAtP1_010790 [Trichoderma atroviride]|uniref:uncharacterized protein n=1 Tax=Hypocrea atroviridis TaxID=63577 RepID=UPI003320D888|nr:hypothetical protein TrAtP1_010790 [Trichoderma atroviride]
MDPFAGDAYETSQETGSSWKQAWPFGVGEEIYDPLSTFSTLPDIQYLSEAIYFESNKNICLGRIINVKVQLSSHHLPGLPYNVWPKEAAQHFTIVQEGDYFALEYNGDKFGCLNKGLCGSLLAVVAGRQALIQAYASNEDLMAVSRDWHILTLPSLPAEINIYSARSDAKDIDNILSRFGIFLQYPRHGHIGFEYITRTFSE